MRISRVVLAASLVGAVVTPAISADPATWTLRVHGAFVESTASHDSSFDSGIASTVDIGGGVGVGAEYRLSDRLGLEASVLFAGLELGMSLSTARGTVQSLELSVVPLTLGLPIHLDVGERVDLYVAPTLSLVSYTDVRMTADWSGFSSSVEVDSDIGLGAALGLDVPFGKGKWAFSTGLRYMKTSAERTDIDPVIATVGMAYRF